MKYSGDTGASNPLDVQPKKWDLSGLGIPMLLRRAGLSIDDIGLREANEAFASQAIYFHDFRGIDPGKLNVNGGGIVVGHPSGLKASRLACHALIEARPRGVRWAVVSMCVAVGMESAGHFETPN